MIRTADSVTYDYDEEAKAKVFVITNMVMNGTPVNSIYAEYSGDTSYQKSTSELYLFGLANKIDTEIEITDGTKDGNIITSLTGQLTSKTSFGDKTGSIKFTSDTAVR